MQKQIKRKMLKSKMENTCIVAGVVTHNPLIERLINNINSIIPYVARIIIVDNCSTNIDDIKLILKNNDKIELFCNVDNFGIAKALNQIMEYAYDKKYQWCITLDQDSVCPVNIIDEARDLFYKKGVGQIVPLIYEANANEYCYLGNRLEKSRFQVVNKSITSAAITNTAVWKRLGGFDESLFIDYVDYDYAIRLIKNGFQIIRMNNVILNHQIGNSTCVKIFGKMLRVSNHSAFRKYYMGRNITIYIRRYRQEISVGAEILRLVKILLVTILFENHKWNKIKNFLNGIACGMRYKI